MEERNSAEVRKRLGFLFKTIPVPHRCIAAWLASPEFVSDMLDIISDGRRITNDDVLRSMDRVYELYQIEINETGRLRPGIWYGSLRQGRNRLREVLKSNQNGQ